MPGRVNSFVSLVPTIGFIVVATIMACSYSSARAESACVERPNQPATEGTRWNFRYDRAKDRKCWFLEDVSTNSHDVATPQGQPSTAPTPTLSSRLAELFGGLTGLANPTNAAPQGTAPQSNPTTAPHKPSAAHAIRTENGVRASQRNNVVAHAAKHTPTPPAEPSNEVLFEEFLKWHESQQKSHQSNSPPASQ